MSTGPLVLHRPLRRLPCRLAAVSALVWALVWALSPSANAATAKGNPKASGLKARSGYAGRFELGALRTLSGARALRVSYYVLPALTLGTSLGMATFSHREANDEGEFKKIRTVGRLMLALEAMHWPLKLQGNPTKPLRADLGFGGRFSFYWGFTGDDGDDDATLDTPIELGLELPIAVRLWVGPNIHITPAFGILFRYVPGSRKPDQNNDTDSNPGSGVGERLGTSNGPGFGVEFGDHAGMFVGISLGYLFGR